MSSEATIPGAYPVTSGPLFHFFGYYDKFQVDATGTRLLTLEVDFMDRTLKGNETARICVIDMADGNRLKHLSETSAWCWQQADMLQWLPSAPDREIIFNFRVKDHFACRTLDLESGKQRTYARPIYTLDEEFLKEYAYPIMRECVRFYLDYLKTGDDGRYHIPESAPYETWLRCRDTTSDLAHIRRLFSAFIDTANKFSQDRELADCADEVLDNLADFIHTEIPEGTEIEGKPQPRTKVMSCGIDIKTETPADVSYRGKDGQVAGGHVANAQLSPIFPVGLVGLDTKGTEEFEILENTLRCFDPVGIHGHTIRPICLARMGMSEVMESALKDWAGHYQLFPQGLFCYFRRDYKELDEKGLYANAYSASHHTIIGLTNNVKILAGQPEERIDFPKRPFAHMAMEAGSILETAINEMLLQSYSGKIRVFPAIPEGWAGTFKLHAVGGFVVTSERKNSEILYVAIESKGGKICCVINPWEEKEPIRIRDLTEDKDICSGEYSEIEFDTCKDHVYLVERIASPISDLKHEKITGKKNQRPKQSGQAILGKARQF